jgi:two-component system sensor histidine kinase SenX3
MIVLVAVLAAAAAGITAAALMSRSSAAGRHRGTLAAPQADGSAELLTLIEALPGPVLLLGPAQNVRYASGPAERIGLVKADRVAFPEIASIAAAAADRASVAVEILALRRPPFLTAVLDLRVRAIPLAERNVLLLIDDLTQEQRVATVRRDFIANVSHELKTPVGAILLLSEAMMSSRDDVEAVQHFAERTHAEATRLSNLVNDVIDLSRLQGEDPLATAEMVAVDDLVHEAMDYVQATAEAKHIRIELGGTTGLKVRGMPDQLVAAIRNLLANAISYSPEHTQVAVAVQSREAMVQIAVKDQGIGIAPEDQNRIFERFYRVDEARSRGTGGTGLGLAIARNVCRNHGGDVVVWSIPGEGSTFTIQLPPHGGAADASTRGMP